MSKSTCTIIYLPKTGVGSTGKNGSYSRLFRRGIRSAEVCSCQRACRVVASTYYMRGTAQPAKIPCGQRKSPALGGLLPCTKGELNIYKGRVICNSPQGDNNLCTSDGHIHAPAALSYLADKSLVDQGSKLSLYGLFATIPYNKGYFLNGELFFLTDKFKYQGHSFGLSFTLSFCLIVSTLLLRVGGSR